MEVINCDELFNTISKLTPTEYNNKYNTNLGFSFSSLFALKQVNNYKKYDW